MTLDLRLNPASFRRHINTSTDVRTGRQVDVDYWFYFILYSENQCISKLDKIGIFIDMKFH